MLRYFIPVLLLAAIAACSDKPMSPAMTAKGANISIEYGAPSKRGREVFGALVPYDEIWRTGANDATVISLKTPFFVGEYKLAPGKYSLWTIPGAQQWKVIFNRQTGQWGTDYDPGQDVLTYTTIPGMSEEVIEQMQFSIQPAQSGEDLVLGWDKLRLTIPFRTQAAAPTDTTQAPVTPNN